VAALDGTGGVPLTLSPLVFNPTGNGDCILMGGSGSGNGIGFTRTGAGDVFDEAVAAAIESQVNNVLTIADLASASGLQTVDNNVDLINQTLYDSYYADIKFVKDNDGLVSRDEYY